MQRPEQRPPSLGQILMAELDADADGSLSDNEINDAPKALRQLDRNGDGKLTGDELVPREALRRSPGKRVSTLCIEKGVRTISPSSAEVGASALRIVCELNAECYPPVPPEAILPISLQVGPYTATAVTRRGNQIEGSVSIPVDSAPGRHDVIIDFPGPGMGLTIRAVGRGLFAAAQATAVGEADAAPRKVEVPPSVHLPYAIVDTGQNDCYNNTSRIEAPDKEKPFYGQDGQYRGLQPSYRDNGNGTVTDLNTGLIWQKDPTGKITFSQALAGASTCRVGGYDDWRLPTIKELYSLINFSGSIENLKPYLDTTSFGFSYPDTQFGKNRIIDAQYWSSTEYLGTTMGGNATVFGVNFADGRIKGYPRDHGRKGTPMRQFVRYVRGNPDYGKNDFVDNGDGTIADRATGLMWQKSDSGRVMNWGDALAFAEKLEYAGYTDWRLPNAKELQSIVDYTRAPDASVADRRGPALAPIFDLTETESYFWTSTTHLDHRPSFAVYIAFGQAFGVFPGAGENERRLVNVHGAGAQRSDPKSGDPARWADGFGPQKDDRRILNYVRAVRDVGENP